MRKQFLIGLAFAASAAYFCIQDSGALRIIAAGHAAESGYVQQASNERGVKVTVTPQGISSAAKTWDFQMVLESHTRDLGDDLVKAALLIADGRQYPPLGWEGAPPGGHHRKGKLRFKAIVPQPRAMELQIRLAGDTAPRSFKWPLK